MAEKNPKCTICRMIDDGSDFLVYSDNDVMAVLAEDPAIAGHIHLFPKKHFTIFEQVPDKTVEHIFKVANKLSTALFESLGMQGTNIIVTNGVAAGQKHSHFLVNILPRAENDGLMNEWQPKQLTEEEMSSIELKLKDFTASPNFGKEPENAPNTEKKKEEIKQGEEENYLIKSLERIP